MDLPRASGSLGGVAYGAGQFVVVGDDGVILTSPDGIDWLLCNSGEQDLHNVIYADGQFVTVGSGNGTGAILTSTNGSSWVVQNFGLANDLNGLAYGNGLFVAGAGAGVVTSPDGATWTVQQFGNTNIYVTGTSYGNGVFVAVAINGIILTSTDGVAWITSNSGILDNLYSVTYANGEFLATGEASIILTSTDGTNWIVRNSGTMNVLFGAAFGQNTFVVVGSGGTILQSGVLPSPGAALSPVPGWANGVFGLTLSAPVGWQWEVQASTDLQNWTTLGTVTITNTPMPFIDTGATNFPQRFYRAVSP